MAHLVGLDVRFDRADKTYREGETVSGVVVVGAKTELKHDGLYLEVDGSVRIQLSGKEAGVLGVLSASNVKPIQLACWSSELLAPGKIPGGAKNSYPFKFKIEPKTNKILYETYHGVRIAVQYVIKCELKRSFPSKSVHKNVEFLIEYTKSQQLKKASNEPVAFNITPQTIRSNQNPSRDKWDPLPDSCKISGVIDSKSLLLDKPVTGELTIHQSEVPIKEINIQLHRIETIGDEKVAPVETETSEIMTLQIADGDPPRALPIPIFLVLPRLFTCASLETPNFKLNFEISILIIFKNDFLIKESFPISLHRW